jgi:hypothetical protein
MGNCSAFGTEVQQPVAGDFAFNRGFIDQALCWIGSPESASFYGIDMWLTARAAARHVTIHDRAASHGVFSSGTSLTVGSFPCAEPEFSGRPGARAGVL